MERGLRRKVPIIDDIIIEENFCYWQENVPETNIQIYNFNQQKICLLRMNEYKIIKEAGFTDKINIFCPYKNKEDGLSCIDYLLIKDIK